MGKTWQIDTSFYLPSESAVEQSWVNGDTIIMPIKQPSYLRSAFYYSSKKSHKKDEWEVIQTNSDIIKWKVYDGNIYYSGSNEFTPKIHRYNLKTKTDSVITVNSKTSIYVEDIIVEGHKIWANTSDSLMFSDNTGKTWRNIDVPFAKPFYFVYKIDEFLFITKLPQTANPRDGEPDNKTFGIYISKDNGQSWSPFIKGIYFNNSYFSATIQKIDDNIYLFGGEAIWRVNMSDLRQNYQNSISGYVFDDKNKNSVKDNSESFLKNIKVSLKNNQSFTYSDSSGFFNINTRLEGIDSLKVTPNSKLAISTPLYHKVSQTDTSKNFGIFLPQNINDVKINLTVYAPPRINFPNSYLIQYQNSGSTPANGKITFTYHPKQALIEASIPPISNINQTLTWNYTNLLPNEARTIRFSFLTGRDLQFGTPIIHIATIDPISIDTSKEDNIDTAIETVVGSYDPNDKQVTFNNSKTPPSVIDPSTELIYTIRFQNTGNYPADFVKVVDTLSEKLDLTTFRLIATSHKGDVSVRNKNVLVFDFNPIYLPDSLRDEAGSHGFVKFAIKPKKTLTKDEAIKNTGYIYFDYNPAIVTNTVETANLKTSIFTPSVLTNKLAISPNPTQQIIKVEIEDIDFIEGTLSIYDLSGRLMLTKSISNKMGYIDVSSLSAGEYICTLKSSNNKVFMNKFVKVE